MTLNKQLENLVEEAPKYGVPTVIMESGVIPVITIFAKQLNFAQYHLRQTIENNFVVTVLGSQENPQLEKKVIYAFPTDEDAMKFPDSRMDNEQIMTDELPVTQILFLMFTMKGVDSIIFLDQPEDYQQSKEIYCHKLQSAIRQNLSNLVNSHSLDNTTIA